MKRLMLSVVATILGAAVAVGTAAAAPAGSPGQPPPIPTPKDVTPNPWPGKKAQGLFFYVETVTASPGESVWGGAANERCTQTNFFARKERAVWHMAAVDTKTGKVVTNADVAYAYLKVPGMQNIPVTYVPHGKDPATAPWTWTARWDIPPDYPVGIVNFEFVMKLKGWPKNKVASFTQIPLAPEQMTVIAQRTY